MVLKLSDLKTDVHNDWCPGCGDFGIEAGLKMALTELPIDINKLVLFSGIGCSGKIVHFTNIARNYAYNTKHLKETVKKAVAHKGFALVDILQPCPTYNDINTKEWYGGEDRIDPATKKPTPRPYELEATGYDGRITPMMSEDDVEKKMSQIIEKSREWGDKIPIGVFYQNETIPTYGDRIKARQQTYLEVPPSGQQLARPDGTSPVNLASLSKQLLFERLVLAQ